MNTDIDEIKKKIANAKKTIKNKQAVIRALKKDLTVAEMVKELADLKVKTKKHGIFG